MRIDEQCWRTDFDDEQAEYAETTVRTLERDLATLEEMELITRGPSGYRARKELALAFLPRRRDIPGQEGPSVQGRLGPMDVVEWTS
jgi:hypothetical protein